MAETILVTGAAGFIGSHFVEHLLEHSDVEILAIDNFSSNYDVAQKRSNIAAFSESPRVDFQEVDFCDLASLEAMFKQRHVDRIVHLGAWAGVRQSVEVPLVYYHNNVIGTIQVLEAARKWPVKSFVLVSSSTVYGRHAEIPFVESDALCGPPASPYGVTKRAAELAGINYFQLHGIPVTCVRPFSVYGPRLRPDLALTIFVEKVLGGQPITVFGDGTAVRDFTHVSDICTGLFKAMDCPACIGECINLGHGQPISVIELIRLVESACGTTADVRFKEAQPAELTATFADLTKAQSLLGFAPRVKAAEGVPSFVDWYQNHSKVSVQS